MEYVKNMRSGYGVVLEEKQLFLIVPEKKVSSEQIKEYINAAREYTSVQNPILENDLGDIIFSPTFEQLLDSFIRFMKINYNCEVIKIAN